jgi:hypothetical protein
MGDRVLTTHTSLRSFRVSPRDERSYGIYENDNHVLLVRKVRTHFQLCRYHQITANLAFHAR